MWGEQTSKKVAVCKNMPFCWHWFLFGVLSVPLGFTATLREFTCIYIYCIYYILYIFSYVYIFTYLVETTLVDVGSTKIRRFFLRSRTLGEHLDMAAKEAASAGKRHHEMYRKNPMKMVGF